ncbi:MAG: TorF family putative porin [Gammaproteobacteria bacterium]
MKKITSKLSFAAAVSLALAAAYAPLAAAEEAKPDNEVSFNAAVTSEYRYRGISQSRLKPAVQGGVDYVNNPSGFYAGAWASTIKWIKDVGGDASAEIDVYGGKRGDFGGGFSYDVGGLYYWYPSNELHPSANTFEVYGQVGYGPAYVKYSHSTTNLFGTPDSKGSGYLDVGANIEVASGLVLNLHAGRQRVAHNGAYSYNDYKIGLTKDLGFASVSLAFIKADTDAYVSPVGNKDLGKSRAVVALSKTF